MFKLGRPSLCKPLSIIFKSCISQIKFPMEYKKSRWCFDPPKKKINSALKTTERSLCCWSRLSFNELCNFLMKMIQSGRYIFFYKQSNFGLCPENCLSFSKKPPQRIIWQLVSRWSINFYCLNIQTF